MKTQLWKTIKSRPYLITFCAVFVLLFLRFGISSIQRGKATAFVLLGIAIIAALLSFPLVRIENLIRIRVLEYKIKKLKKVLSDNYYPEMQNKLAAVDAMDGHEFEYFCAELLKENGFVNVEVTQASGDFGVDVLAEKDGVTYAVQCKCYSDKVGKPCCAGSNIRRAVLPPDGCCSAYQQYIYPRGNRNGPKDECLALGQGKAERNDGVKW